MYVNGFSGVQRRLVVVLMAVVQRKMVQMVLRVVPVAGRTDA
jgi:hypothetical protein